MSTINDALLRRILHSAIHGPDEIEALNKLQELSAKRSTVFRRALPVVSHHLRTPAPRVTAREALPKEEVLATIALGTLTAGIEASTRDDHPVETLLLAQLSDVLRWMTHLFTKWIFNPLPAQLRNPEISPQVEVFGRGLRASLGTILRWMAEHPAICSRLKEQRYIGTLLSEMTIVANRDREFSFLLQARLVQYEIAMVSGAGSQPYLSAFSELLEAHATTFGETMISHIQDYAYRNDPIKRYLPEISTLLIHLITCTCDTDTLLDACLKAEGVISTLMHIFRAGTETLQKSFKPRAWPKDGDDLVALIFSIAATLARCFVRAGATLISLALEQGFLKSILSLITILDIPGAPKHADLPQINDLDAHLHEAVDTIITHAVHPSVIRSALPIFELFDAEKAYAKPPSRMRNVSSALGRLCTRLSEELMILGCSPTNAASVVPKLYKFCDNVQCPSMGKITKLGRCSACRSGYYCSQYCQKAVWKKHRKECKEICANTKGQREGFPPVWTVHDHRYFAWTLPQRFSFYGKTSHAQLLSRVSAGSVVEMDLRGFPVPLNTSQNPDFDGKSGPVIVAMIPTGVTLNRAGGVQISVMGAHRSQMNG